MSDPDASSSPRANDGAFPRTRWTWIQQVEANDEDAGRALAKLCEAYWFPVYSYVRRAGRSPQDAEDLTQGFFAKMLEKGVLGQADETRGRFRNFLLTALKRFLTDEHRKEHADKRGGMQSVVSIDQELAEQRYQNEPCTSLTPEDLFERQWAETLLQQVFSALRKDYCDRGKEALYTALEPYLSWHEATTPQQTVANHLGMKIATMRSEIFQLRRRYGSLLHDIIANTVDTRDAVEDELKHLRVIFSKR